MSDFDGGAAASTDSPSTPIEPVTHTPEPVSTEREAAPEPKPDSEPSKPVSTREALQKAREAVEKRESGKGEEKATPIKDGPTRSEDGKFAAKEDQQKPPEVKPTPTQPEPVKPAGEPVQAARKYEAPARFSPEAKAAWDSIPETAQAETHRAIEEMTKGIEKHRASAEAYETVRRFDEMAKQGGGTLAGALEQYVGLENLVRANPIQGMEAVCQNLGVSFRAVAEAYLNRTPDQAAAQSDRTINDLRRELNDLKQQLGGVTSHVQTQRMQSVTQQIEAFASQPEHARFDELSETIHQLLSTKMAANLSEAYSMADRLNPAQVQASAPAVEAPMTAPPKPQKPQGGKSISGAPSPGSDPAAIRQPSSSISEALKRAVARAG